MPRRGLLAIVLPLLAGAPPPSAVGATVYRCESAEGPVFSDRPCGDEAATLRIEAAPRAAAGGPAGVRTAPNAPPVEPQKVMEAFLRTPQEVRDLLGLPAAGYTNRGVQHWFYPNIRRSAPRPGSPELRFSEDRLAEVVWLKPEVMARSVRLARSLAQWESPERPRRKRFTAAGLALGGLGRYEVGERLGEPDGRLIEDGLEVWRYERVAASEADASEATLRVVFDEDTVQHFDYR